MVTFIILWGCLIAMTGWLAITIIMSFVYSSNKENGNLWVFAFFDVLAVIFGLILNWVYVANNFPAFTSLAATILFVLIIVYAVLAICHAIIGRSPKQKA